MNGSAHGVYGLIPAIPIAHRGAHGHSRPENSLEALTHAVALGAAFVEFDVWPTPSGQLVVSHDRPCAPRWWTWPRGQTRDETVGPSVEPFLQVVAEAGVLLNLDWKGRGHEDRVVDLLSLYGLLDRTIVSSTNPSALVALRQASPRIRTGLSISSHPKALQRLSLSIPGVRPLPAWSMRPNRIETARGWLLEHLPAILDGARTDALMIHHPLASQEVVRRLRAEGAGVFLWTVRDVATFEALDRLGADGIATDDIARQLARARPITPVMGIAPGQWQRDGVTVGSRPFPYDAPRWILTQAAPPRG